MDSNELSRKIIGAAIEVHKALGPGLFESAYEECLCREFELKSLSHERQKPQPVVHKGRRLDDRISFSGHEKENCRSFEMGFEE
ncbi:MAG: GxxExxY protein [Deltaproteobacteria bacterium]|nr:GxxExxY protein [Deltaproteobacteria bacterium]